MRLICPNCDAEYEVDDTAIPSVGRDVQCSACGHAWFQNHPQTLAEAEDEAELYGDAAASEPQAPQDWAEAPERAAPQAPEPEDVLMAQSAAQPPIAEAEPEAEPAPAVEPLRRSIDESVLAVLREEAEREAAARRGERPPLETQTEMTLPETARPVTARPAAPRPEPVKPAPTKAVAPIPEAPVEVKAAPRKRELLPAIEEIKSSLQPSLDPEDADEEGAASPRKEGFASGLVLVLLVAVVLLAVYVMSPLIIETVPALRGPVASYVAGVNDLRIGLDAQLQGLIGWLQGLAAGTSG